MMILDNGLLFLPPYIFYLVHFLILFALSHPREEYMFPTQFHRMFDAI